MHKLQKTPPAVRFYATEHDLPTFRIRLRCERYLAHPAPSIYVTCSPEVEGVTGRYFDSKGRERNSSVASYDEGEARRLWKISEQLTELKRLV